MLNKHRKSNLKSKKLYDCLSLLHVIVIGVIVLILVRYNKHENTFVRVR